MTIKKQHTLVLFLLLLMSCDAFREDSTKLSDVKAVPNITEITLEDLNGSTVELSEVVQKENTVFCFLSPECPLSKNYSLVIRNLHTSFSSKGIQFFNVFPGTYYTRDEIQEFVSHYQLEMPALLDPGYMLTAFLKASVTPEVFLWHKEDEIVYSGAIDNWAIDLGKQRKKATENYLEDAIVAVIASEEVKLKRTQPIGCYIE